MSLSRTLQYAFIAIIVTTVGFSLYQWNASRASTQKTAPNNGLVGYWSFDENTGTQAGDASGNGNTGTLTGGPTWTTGKLGQALSLDGVDDYVDAGNSSSVKPSFPFTVSVWVKRSTSGDAMMVTTGDTATFGNYSGYHLVVNTDGSVDAGIGNNGSCSASYRNDFFTSPGIIGVGLWYHVTAVFTNANSFSIYVNGSIVSVSQGGNFGLGMVYAPGARLRIGSYFVCAGSTAYLKAVVDEVRIYNRALSSTEITNLYNLGAEKLNVSPTANLTSGLVGYWTFDGKDTPWSSSSAGTVTDKSGNGNTGTLTNMSRTTSSVSGKLGQALNFDGVDDYVSTTLDSSASSFTLSAWVRSRNTANNGDRRTFLSKRGGGDEWILYQNSSTDQKIGFAAWDSGGAGTKIIAGTTALVANQWYHVAVTYDGTTATLFINGTAENSTSTGNAIFNTANYIVIGKESLRPWDGSLDEVRVYNRALSSTEVQSLYDLGASDKVNSSVSQNQGVGRLDSGLVGYWKLDDGSGTTATDSSVNGNNGTLTGGPTWGTGRIGGDVVFDGVNDYIDLGNRSVLNLTNNFTVSVWANINNLTQSNYKRLFGRAETDTNNRPFYIEYDYAVNQYRALWRNAGTFGVALGKTLTAVGWQHFVVTFKDGVAKSYSDGVLMGSSSGVVQPVSTSSNTYIGDIGGFNFPGQIDEVRVYNRVLSDDEVSQLYRLTAPTSVDTSLKGYWSFDGSATNWTSSSAGTVADLSGSGNTGTLTNMSRATSSVSGKLGQALNFDGVDDYISTTGTQSVQNVSYWVKPSTSTYSKYSLALSGAKRYFLNNGLYSGTNTATRYINATTPSMESLGSEILTGTFESGAVGSWGTYYQGGGVANASVTSSAPYAGTYSANITVSGWSPSIFDIQFRDSASKSVTAGTLYKFQFAAKGSVAQNGLVAALQQLSSPWSSMSPLYVFDLTTSWVLHTVYFYSSNTDSNVAPYFYLGGFGGFIMYLDNISLKPVTSVGDVTTGAWNFVSVNLDNPVTADSIKLGFDSGYLKGSIDEVRVYNRALTAAEITALYNSGR